MSSNFSDSSVSIKCLVLVALSKNEQRKLNRTKFLVDFPQYTSCSCRNLFEIVIAKLADIALQVKLQPGHIIYCFYWRQSNFKLVQPLKVYSEIVTNDAPIQHFSTQFCIVLVFRYSQNYKTVSTVTAALSTAVSLLPNSKTFYKLLPEAIISRFARFFQNLARIKISTLKLLQEF